MKVEIITLGTELLNGIRLDTNSTWIGEQITAVGGEVIWKTSVADTHREIEEAIRLGLNRADLVITTGGLGPTRDDITKQVLCEMFDAQLVHSPEIEEHIRELFAFAGRKLNDLNKSQAWIPDNCTILKNNEGTASGMWFDRGEKALVALPGVPYEMKHLIADRVLPKLSGKFKLLPHVQRTILVQGMPESILANKIENELGIELPAGASLAYLPSPGLVRFRVYGSTKGNFDQFVLEVERYLEKVSEAIPECVFGEEDDTLEKVIGELMQEKGMTLATAESCTGGYISHLITRIPGSSQYFKGGVVAYSPELKMQILGVPSSILETYSVVSEEVAAKMAEGAAKVCESDIAIATTGVAGPGGGSEEIPVGTVCIAVSIKGKTITDTLRMGNNRERTIRKSALYLLNRLRVELN